MNSDYRERAITNIDHKYILEALTYKKRTTNRLIKIMGSIAACVTLVFGLSFSGTIVALAAGNETAFEVVYAVFPEIAMKFVPVNEFCENNGIKMCVESIRVDGDSADVSVSLQDLAEDRIDGTTDLFDSYDFKTSGDQMAGCSLVSYEESTRKATFLIHVETMNGKTIRKDKITFSLKKFLSGKQEVTRELTEMKEFEVVNYTQTISNLKVRGMSGLDCAEFSDKDIENILCVNEKQSFSPVQGVTITAYGFVNGKLHIQAYYSDIAKYDNHGWISLISKTETIQPNSLGFWDEDGIGSYEEYIFDVGEDEINNYKVNGEFVTCDLLTTGDWSVTFSLTDQ